LCIFIVKYALACLYDYQALVHPKGYVTAVLGNKIFFNDKNPKFWLGVSIL
jgi:hypothetical protein